MFEVFVETIKRFASSSGSGGLFVLTLLIFFTVIIVGSVIAAPLLALWSEYALVFQCLAVAAIGAFAVMGVRRMQEIRRRSASSRWRFHRRSFAS